MNSIKIWLSHQIKINNNNKKKGVAFLLTGSRFIQCSPTEEPQFAHVPQIIVGSGESWLLNLSQTPSLKWFSWRLSQQWHHQTADPLQAEWYKNPIVYTYSSFAHMSEFWLKKKAQENMGWDRSRIPKCYDFYHIPSQFPFLWVKAFIGKPAAGHKVHDLLTFRSSPFLFLLHPTPSRSTKSRLWHW